MLGRDPLQHLVQQAVLALQPVGLVDHDVAPLYLAEVDPVLHHHLVVGQQHVEDDLPAAAEALVVPDDLPGGGVAVVRDGVELRRPLVELLLPGGHRGQRHTHQHRALEREVVPQVLYTRDIH